jgi:hypothetical protein
MSSGLPPENGHCSTWSAYRKLATSRDTCREQIKSALPPKPAATSSRPNTSNSSSARYIGASSQLPSACFGPSAGTQIIPPPLDDSGTAASAFWRLWPPPLLRGRQTRRVSPRDCWWSIPNGPKAACRPSPAYAKWRTSAVLFSLLVRPRRLASGANLSGRHSMHEPDDLPSLSRGDGCELDDPMPIPSQALDRPLFRQKKLKHIDVIKLARFKDTGKN